MFTKTALSTLILSAILAAALPVTTGNAEPLVLSEIAIETLDPGILLPNPVSCSGAKKLVKDAGYKKIKKIECNGTVYTFKAKKDGAKLVVTVNKYSKEVSAI